MRRRVYLGAGAAALVAGSGLRWWVGHDAHQPMLDEAFWSLSMRSAAGPDVAMQSYRGKPLLLNFWATWCAPCVREMPALERFQRQFGPRGWQVLGLAIDQIAPVLIFSQKIPVTFPLLIAEAEGLQLSTRLGNAGGLPFTVLVDATGRVRHSKMGETNLEELTAWAKGMQAP